MSLRKGHLRSKVWAPPALVDDWRDEAKCTGMMTTEIPVETCTDCPVKEPCGLLYDELDLIMNSGRKQDRRPMPGVWGGIDHTAEIKAKAEASRFRKTSNFGPCTVVPCDRQSESQELCGMHYQRWQRRREHGMGWETFLAEQEET